MRLQGFAWHIEYVPVWKRADYNKPKSKPKHALIITNLNQNPNLQSLLKNTNGLTGVNLKNFNISIVLYLMIALL